MRSIRAGESTFGLVQVYTGDGKGKTSAALGLALRAAGWGYRTFIGQFMKGRNYGELHSLLLLAPYITVEQFGEAHFVRVEDVRPEDTAAAQHGLQRIRLALHSGCFQIVVMDEACVALHFGLLALGDVLALVQERPAEVELVLTGRRAPAELLAVADLVTAMCEVRHPYRLGMGARVGIEQ